MLKALFKKQFMELFRAYFVSKKNGQARTRGKTIALFVLFFVLLVYFGCMCFGLAFGLGSALIPAGLSWLYFSLMGIMTIMLGVFGSIFNTYTALYRAKDNDLLISMPIPPSRIVLVRLSTVFGLALLYSGVIWIPTLLYYWLFASPSVPAVIFGVLLWLFIAAFVTVLTCALGWVVALVASRISSKSFVTVILSVILLGAYYVFCFRMTEFFNAMVENSEAIGGFLKVWFNFLYQLGQAAAGDALGMLIFSGVTLVLSALCLWLMARTFIRLATQNATARRKTRTVKTARVHGARAALLRRELKRFGSSATYMLNCGLGLAFMVALSVIALLRQTALQAGLFMAAARVPWLSLAAPVLAATVSCAMASLNAISAPSVSLEGKNLWILQSLPVDAADVLKAKLWLHVLISAELAMATTGVLCLSVQTDWMAAVLAMVYTALFVWLTGALDLMIGLRHPSLNWTTETQPIKQSLSVFLALMVNIGLTMLLAVPYFPLAYLMDVRVYLALVIALMAGLIALLHRWLNRTGAKLFAQL